jgi:peptidoglycan-N-acetylglucosamine deacetylase
MNLLTFDIEDWYHILDNTSTKSDVEWKNFESRLHANTDRILDFLQLNNLKATFFCLGWVAANYPDIIRKIDKLGYEIGVHSFMHQLIYEQSVDDFRNDTQHSIRTIEDLTGRKVTSYRAPGFSVSKYTLWAFEILISEGILADSSVFPAQRGHGGFAGFPVSKPCIINYKGMTIKEFPLNTCKIIGKHFVFSGGGYFRLLPYWAIKSFSSDADYIMTYFHPRDFDHEQPVINDLPLYRKFKSYYGLSNAMYKLQKWVNDFNFIDIHTADTLIDWTKMETIKLND